MRKLFTVICAVTASLLIPMARGQTPAATPPAPISITIEPSSATPTPAASPATATASAAAAASTGTSVTSAKTAPPPIPPPNSVPDDANPFADEKNMPTPLATINISCTPMNADIHTVQFDGMQVLSFFVDGPDFEWLLDPLDDWALVPKGMGESFAFVYTKNPAARLSFSLYGEKEFMPDISPASIILYLAAVRENDPRGFILTTPIPKGTETLPLVRFAMYGGQGVTYATTTPVLLLHHDWFADLNGEYQLVVKLTSPPALISRLETQLQFVFNRASARKGLGVVPPAAPGSAPPADTAKPVNQ